MEKTSETQKAAVPLKTSPQPNKKLVTIVNLILGAIVIATGGWYVGVRFQSASQNSNNIKISDASQPDDADQSTEVNITLPAKTINPKQLVDIYLGKIFPAFSTTNPIYTSYDEGDFHAAVTVRQYPMDNFYMQSCTNNASDYEPACINIAYDDLNTKHQALFGSSRNLAKKDYSFNCAELKYYPQEGSSGYFLYQLMPCGAIFEPYVAYQVKDVSITEKGFNVNIYYTVIEFDLEGSSEMTKYKKVATLANGEKYKWQVDESVTEVADFTALKDQLSRLPVYQLIFIKDADNYILNDIIKQ